jgi:serine/threonine-protein kinase
MYRGAYAPVVPLRPGAVVAGTYRVGGMLGQGGMGAVYQAVHVESGEVLAIKVMRSEHAADASMAERFEREALMAQRVKSPFVSGVRDFGRSKDGTMYLVMDLLRGKSLAQHIEDQVVLPWREGARIARDVARALVAVHTAGVLHRDLKPDNVFLCADGQVKLLDFGIAKEYGPGWQKGEVKGKPLTQAGTVLGTPLYMSPEAVTQSPLGPPADLYALGALLFEMVTGRMLFEEEQPVLLMGMHLRVKPDRVSAVRSDLGIPRELDALVDQLLSKDPKKRPTSAAAVAETLDALSKTVPHSGSTGAFAPVSALEHRRAAAALPTAITARPSEGPTPIEEGDLNDTTIPRGPFVGMTHPVRISVPTLEPLSSDDEPATILEKLPPVGPDTTPNRVLTSRRVLVVAMPIAVGLALVLWAATGPSDPVPGPAVPSAGPASLPVVARPEEPMEIVAPHPVPEVGVAPLDEVTIRFAVLPEDAVVSEDGRVIAARELRVPRDGSSHTFLFQARGRIPQRVPVTADEDRVVRVELARRRSGPVTTGGGTHGDIAREF